MPSGSSSRNIRSTAAHIDPAGNFTEYYSDMDCIVEDQLWKPETLESAKGLFSWGPPPHRRSSSPKTSQS